MIAVSVVESWLSDPRATLQGSKLLRKILISASLILLKLIFPVLGPSFQLVRMPLESESHFSGQRAALEFLDICIVDIYS